MDKKTKTVMIAGAGIGQLPAIIEAKKMGLKVVAVDMNPNAVGLEHADIALTINPSYEDALITQAKKYKIDGIMTMQTDALVPAVGAVIDELGLTGSGENVAIRCSNKGEARKALEEKGVSQPKFGIVSSLEEAMNSAGKIGYPVIIKPADSSGSRGVSKVVSEKQLETAFDHARQYTDSPLMVEEYIEGLEVGAQSYSIDGKCKLVLVHNDTLTEPPYMVPVGHSFPAKLNKDVIEKIKITTSKAVEALGIKDGPANIDIIINKEGNPKIIEIGARIGATCLPELVHYFTGINWTKQAVRTCLGEKASLKQTKSLPCAALILESNKDGVLKSFKIDKKIKNIEGVEEIEVTAKPGDEIHKFRKGTDRIGKVVVTGKDVEDAERKAQKVKDLIRFEVA